MRRFRAALIFSSAVAAGALPGCESGGSSALPQQVAPSPTASPLTCAGYQTPYSSPGLASLASWTETKATQSPSNALPAEFEAPSPWPVATLGWEDGIYISRDGLTLYSDYFPLDLLTVAQSGLYPDQFYKFERGVPLGQDFWNPLGQPTDWVHNDVVVSTRSSLSEPFRCWTLSGMRGRVYDLGGMQGVPNAADSSKFDLFVYTDDSADSDHPKGGVRIKLARNLDRFLSAGNVGVNLPLNVDVPAYHEDNPHIERPNAANPNSLVLFFDSDNMPGSAATSGARAIWYTLSADGGTSWTNPAPVTSVNTSADNEQPHLFFDGTSWWLYFSGANVGGDGKLAIFRAKQTTPGNWNSWGARQLVVSAGTTGAVGEPTLMANGDLSFVVATQNANGTAIDKYDADPWIMKRRR